MNPLRSSLHILRALRPALAALLLAAAAPAAAQTSNHNFEVAKQLDIFNALYRDLDLYYVDTLDAKKNVDNAIGYMLEMLDPYTEYFPEEDTDDLRQLTTGKYAGIGALTGFREKWNRCIISQPFAGMPAAQAGLLPGDVILAIDGKPIDPCTDSSVEARTDYANSVSERLRGEPGTTFELKVRRPGTEKTYLFKLTRRQIVRPSVALATLAADSVGYIRLTQFIEGTSNEIRRALVDLKQRGARRLILDLRDNPGGVMEEAVKTVNLFVPRGREVLSMRGKVRELNHTYKTLIDPLDTDIPLIVLTNEQSASAAEITAGALQDYDRALIVGRRTYGKGLVQQSRELPHKSVLKLTTAKYYIPSGRCVQAYTFRYGRPVHLADSLSREFRTANGRIVRDGGGITPDVVVEADSVPRLIAALEASDQLFDFCVAYRATHPTLPAPATFRLSDEDYAACRRYLRDNHFSYDRQSLQVLRTLRRVAELEGYGTEARAELDALEQKLQHNDDYDFGLREAEVRRAVEAALVLNYYYEEGRYEYLLRDDKDVRRAVELLARPKEVQRVLSGEPDA